MLLNNSYGVSKVLYLVIERVMNKNGVRQALCKYWFALGNYSFSCIMRVMIRQSELLTISLVCELGCNPATGTELLEIKYL